MIDAVDVFVGLGSVTLLRPTSLRVEDGEAVAVVGPSGSGKTTLLRCLMGMTTPTSGRVRIDGTTVSSLSVADRARFRREHLGVVFQDPELLDELTAAENVALPLLFSGRARRDALAHSDVYLDRVGTSHLRGLRPATYSRGEAQRVAIARALAIQGRTLVADEPTASLDRDNAVAIARLLIDHGRRENTATVIATHDIELAGMCDRVLDLRHADAAVA
ncbi:ABC transporter ATP-binding protein [Luteimicrobium subarcticum]|uniref:ABC transporter ATP-binding protein n=1 Tax=Luteimicrobium subarcticum TaxID=620910 RepID=UPI0012FE146A|nr:ABC transporter ATP-binding protein [Luteimicrobium subarcticum]